MKAPIFISSLLLLTGMKSFCENRFGYDERPQAYETRMHCAYNENYNVANYDIDLENNGDEKNIPDYAGNFTKTFAHDATTGIATAGLGARSTLRSASTPPGLTPGCGFARARAGRLTPSS